MTPDCLPALYQKALKINSYAPISFWSRFLLEFLPCTPICACAAWYRSRPLSLPKMHLKTRRLPYSRPLADWMQYLIFWPWTLWYIRWLPMIRMTILISGGWRIQTSLPLPLNTCAASPALSVSAFMLTTTICTGKAISPSLGR